MNMKPHLSPRELAEATTVSESSVKRWIEDGRLTAARTAGGHRRIPIAEAIRFIRQANLPLARPGALGLVEAAGAQTAVAVADDPDRQFAAAMLAGYADEARGLAIAMYTRGRSIAEICDGPIVSAMTELGQLWQHDANGIFIEHRATSICIRLLNDLHALLPTADNDAPAAVGGAPSGDPYRIPSLAAAVTLTSVGWRATDLGPDLPVDSLIRAAETHEADLVWLSISALRSPTIAQRTIMDLACDLGERGRAMVVGGRDLPSLPDVALGTLHQAGSMTELAGLAKGLRSRQVGPRSA